MTSTHAEAKSDGIAEPVDQRGVTRRARARHCVVWLQAAEARIAAIRSFEEEAMNVRAKGAEIQAYAFEIMRYGRVGAT